MKRRGSNVVLLVLLLVWMVGTAQAADKPLPPQTAAYGGYAELAAGWLEWVTQIPGSTNPLFDSDGSLAALGQSGKVWFLVGTTAPGTTTRDITVPSGTALFFPIVNYFWVNTPEYGDNPWSPEQYEFVKDLIEPIVDTAADTLVLEIDGNSVPFVDRYRVFSEVGICNLPPDDNIFGVPLAETPHECVADGYWALLPPMSVGNHTVRFAGAFPDLGFSLDVTYNIIVKPRQKVANAGKFFHP